MSRPRSYPEPWMRQAARWCLFVTVLLFLGILALVWLGILELGFRETLRLPALWFAVFFFGVNLWMYRGLRREIRATLGER